MEGGSAKRAVSSQGQPVWIDGTFESRPMLPQLLFRFRGLHWPLNPIPSNDRAAYMRSREQRALEPCAWDLGTEQVKGLSFSFVRGPDDAAKHSSLSPVSPRYLDPTMWFRFMDVHFHVRRFTSTQT